MEYNLVKEVATLTTIPEKSLKKLVSKSVYCLADIAAELNEENNVADIDLGIGTLSIILEGESVHYKYIPSQEVRDAVRSSVLYSQNLLEDALEAALVDKITNTYKDLVE